MIKKIFPIIMAACLAACQTDDVQPAMEHGYVVLGDVKAGEAERVTVATRAVDADLNIEILDAGNTAVVQIAAGNAAAGQKIELAPGTYTLHACTVNVDETYADDVLGAPKFNGTTVFEVQDDKTSYVSFSVPMVNAAVGFSLPDAFDEWFSSYTFVASCNGRTVALHKGELAYFDIADGQSDISYTFAATNADGEEMTASGSFEAVAGASYTVSYDLPRLSLAVSRH